MRVSLTVSMDDVVDSLSAEGWLLVEDNNEALEQFISDKAYDAELYVVSFSEVERFRLAYLGATGNEQVQLSCFKEFAREHFGLEL